MVRRRYSVQIRISLSPRALGDDDFSGSFFKSSRTWIIHKRQPERSFSTPRTLFTEHCFHPTLSSHRYLSTFKINRPTTDRPNVRNWWYRPIELLPLKMLASTRPSVISLANGGAAGKLSQTLRVLTDSPISFSKSCTAHFLQQHSTSRRQFSSTRRTQLKEYFPPPANAPNIKLTGPAWHHPV